MLSWLNNWLTTPDQQAILRATRDNLVALSVECRERMTHSTVGSGERVYLTFLVARLTSEARYIDIAMGRFGG